MINGMFNALSGLKNSAQRHQKSAASLQNSFGFERNIDMVGKAKPGKSELIDTNSIYIDISEEVVFLFLNANMPMFNSSEKDQSQS